MTSLVDIDNIIRQAKEMEMNQLENAKSEDVVQIKPPKKTFWQKLFGKEKDRFATSRKVIDSDDELRKITELRKQLGLDDLPLPTKPHALEIEKEDDPAVEVKEIESDVVDIPTKTELEELRTRLGLDKEMINTREIFDKLDQEANIDSHIQAEQYEKEQEEVTSEIIEEPEVVHKEEHPPLFNSEPEVLEESEPIESDWALQDNTIENDFPEQSAKTLEEENFIISEYDDNLEEATKLPEPIDEETAKILEHGVSEEELLSEVVEDQLEKTTKVLEDLEHGDIPKEDLLKHLDKGVNECKSLLEERRFLDAKYRYNELCQLFERIDLDDQEKTMWFGVLKKTYERILNAEKL